MTCFQFDSDGWNKDFLADTYAGVVYVTSSHGTLYAIQMDGSEVKAIVQLLQPMQVWVHGPN